MIKLIKTVIVLAAVIYAASLAYVISASLNKNIPAHADAIVVLGAVVNEDNTPSLNLYSRDTEALTLFREGKAGLIIATGGVGLGSQAESHVTTRVLEQAGVPGSKILSEDLSHNTLQNFQYIKALAAQNNIHSIIIVTDQYHIARAAMVARAEGFDGVYWDYPPVTQYDTLSVGLDYAREAVALLYYYAQIKLMGGAN